MILNWLANTARPRPQRLRQTSRRSSAHLAVELLEDRRVPAQLFTWTGGGPDTNWSDSQNWDVKAVPTAADDVVIAQGQVTLDSAVSVHNLTLSGGTLTGSNNVAVTGLLTWTGGTMSGSGHTVASGGMTLGGGSGFLTLDGRTIDNNSTANWTDPSTLYGSDGAVWNNAGTLNVQKDSTFFASGVGAQPVFNNAGTLSVAGNTGTISVGWMLNNSGTVSLQSGTLSLAGGGSATGTFATAAGTTLSISHGTYLLQPGASATGAGTVVVNGGTLQIGQDAQHPALGTTVQNLTLSSGTLTGAGRVTVAGLLTWTGGTMSGSGHTVASSNLIIGGGHTQLVLDGRTIDNAGSAAWADPSTLYTSDGAVWNNTGTLDAQGDGSLYFNGTGAPAQFNNSGTLLKSAGSGTTSIGWAFTNTGIVSVQSGTLELVGPFSNFAGTTLTGGTYLVRGTLRFTNANVQTNAANLVLDGSSSRVADETNVDALANFTVNAAAGNFTLHGGRNFIAAGGFSNAGSVTVDAGTTFTVLGTYTQTGGTTNLTGGALTVHDTVNLNGGTLAGHGTIGGNGTVPHAKVVNNGGHVSPGTDTLNVNGNYTQGPGGSLDIKIGGPAAGTQYSQFAVAGSATLGGILNVSLQNTFAPLGGATFQVLTFASRSGTFAATNGTNTGAGLVLGSIYTATAFKLGANHLPVLATISDQTVSEGSKLTFKATATDPDVGQKLTYSLDPGAPAGAAIDPKTGVFTWTPTHGPASATVTIRVTDNGTPALSVSQSVTITGNDVLPVVLAGSNAIVRQGGIFTGSGSFTDPGADSWTATVDYGDGTGSHALPLAADRTFHLRHTYDKAGTFTATVTVTDKDGATGTGTFQVTVTPINHPPVLAAIPDQAVDEGSPLTFTATATDPDVGQKLSYSLDPGAPAGAAIDPNTGVFTWTPPHGPASARVTVRVTDNGNPVLSDSRTFTIIVNNVPPTVDAGGQTTLKQDTALTRTGSFTDPGADIWTGIVDYGDGTATEALTLKPDKTFDLHHIYSDDGNFTVTVTVSDKDGGIGAATFPVTVTAVRHAPVLAAIADRLVSAGSRLQFQVRASDRDEGAKLTYSLDPGAPAGAAIDPRTGVFTWTPPDGPTSAQVTVRVTDDGSPALSDSETFTVNVRGVPPTVHAGDNVSALRTGVTLTRQGSFTHPGTGSWTATVNYGDGTGEQPLVLNADRTFDLRHVYAHAGTYIVTVTIVDKLRGAGTGTFRVGVWAPRHAPVLAPIADQTVVEGNAVKFQARASDQDGDRKLTYSLDAGAPAGATINPRTGVFTWTPQHGPARVHVTVRVTDDGKPAFSDTRTFTIIVNRAPPVVHLGGEADLTVGTRLVRRGWFSDAGANAWTATVNYGDDSGTRPLPLAADKNFSLAHPYLKAGTYTVTVTVTDNDGRVGTSSFKVEVTPPPPRQPKSGKGASLRTV